MRKILLLTIAFTLLVSMRVSAGQPQNVTVQDEFDQTSYFPIKSNKQIFGFGKLEYLYKNDISDWSNDVIQKSKIKSSYELCLSVTTANDFDISNPQTLEMSAALIKDGEVCSTVADIGWLGFGSSVDFFDGGKTEYLCVCIQPLTTGKNWDGIDIYFKTSAGTVYDTVHISSEYVASAKKGSQLRKNDKPIKIKTSDGGVYEVQLGKVYPFRYYSDVIYRMGYRLRMVKTPSRKMFSDRYNKSAKTGKYTMNTGLDFHMFDYNGEMDIAGSEFDELMNYSGDKVYKGVGPNAITASKVKKGEWAYGIITFISTDGKAADEVRLTFGFPEEGRYAGTAKMLEKFNGRMLVIQKKVSGKVGTIDETIKNFNELYNSW